MIKKKDDKVFEEFLKLIKKGAIDERNYVKKGVSWALRSIGKRNRDMNKKALKTAEEIKKLDSKSARYIANETIRELTSEKVKQKLDKQKV